MTTALKEFSCKFCNKKCRKTDTFLHSSASTWRCDYHGSIVVEFIFDNDELYYYTFRTPYKESYYTMFWLNTDTYVDAFNIKNYVGQVIYRTVTAPNFNPEKAKEKLAMYLTFI